MSEVKKVVLAYSGGLDTSVIAKWLQETYNYLIGERVQTISNVILGEIFTCYKCSETFMGKQFEVGATHALNSIDTALCAINSKPSDL